MATPLLLAILGLLLGNSTKKNTQQETQNVRTLAFAAGLFLVGMMLATLLGELVPRKTSATHFTLGCLPVTAKVHGSNCQLKPNAIDKTTVNIEVTNDPLVRNATMKYTTSEPDVTSPLFIWSLPTQTRTSISIEQPDTSTK